MVFRAVSLLFLNALFFFNGSICFAGEDSYSAFEQEINRIKKDLAQIRVERQRAGEDVVKDRKEFSEYRDRTAARRKTLVAEIDSLKGIAVTYSIKRDSLEAFISGVRSKKREIDLSQERFMMRLAAACNRCMAVARRTPPSISHQFIGALTFLLNDCSSKAIDNIEGLRRITQIIQNMEDASCVVQTGQGAPPLTGLRGNADLLRIGSVFEAAVDEKYNTCVLWRGDSAFQPVWNISADRATVTAVRDAINIRGGKTLPAFTTLPFEKRNPKEGQ